MIYFAEASDTNNRFIKIGYSAEPRRRVQSLQASCPMQVKLLGVLPGNKDTERQFHREFRRHRIRGEWYHPHEDLLDTIKVLRNYSS